MTVETINWLLTMLPSIGIPGIIVVLILLNYKRIYKWISSKYYINIGKVKKLNIQNHIIFSNLRDWENHKYKLIKIDTDNKTKLFQDLIKIIVKNYTVELINFIPSDDISLYSNFYSTMLDIKNNIYNEIEKTLPLNVSNKLLTDDKGVTPWLDDNFNTICVYIKDISTSNIYNTDNDKYIAVLDAINFSINLILIDVEKQFHFFNGELEDLLTKDN